jgi:hypothetical protein
LYFLSGYQQLQEISGPVQFTSVSRLGSAAISRASGTPIVYWGADNGVMMVFDKKCNILCDCDDQFICCLIE